MRLRWVILILVLGIAAMLAGAALATPLAYQLDWWTVDSGGGASASDPYSLNGTIGQAEAGSALVGGSFRLEGGFWGGVVSSDVPRELFLPIVVRQAVTSP